MLQGQIINGVEKKLAQKHTNDRGIITNWGRGYYKLREMGISFL